MLALLFVSHNVLHNELRDTTEPRGSYTIKTIGENPLELKGAITFETSVETTSRGVRFVTLKLNLENTNEIGSHSMGFLISRQGKLKAIGSGTYRISEKINGFLKQFDGVFGFANIEVLGESPYFAREGRIVIEKIDVESLSGSMDISLVNLEGKQLIIKGDFSAERTKK